MLVDLVTRTRARLAADLDKVKMLQGEMVYYPGAVTRTSSGTLKLAESHVTPGRNPVLQVTESLRNALAAGPTLVDVKQASGVSVTPTPVSTGAAAPPLKSTLSICPRTFWK